MNLLILDYGSGNIKSVYNSLKFVLEKIDKRYEIIVSNSTSDISKSDFIILPGVGSFQQCKESIFKYVGLVDALYETVLIKSKPFLGICVGMQLLADFGLENGKHEGFGWVKGKVKSLEKQINLTHHNLKIPHMGWNNLEIISKDNILKDISEHDHFYFVHSYYFDAVNSENILALTKYGKNIPSIIKRENIYGLQFHPEKSGYSGQKILKNWIINC